MPIRLQDPHGHGTHVASVAAGTARHYGSTTSDSTGIAPGASVYDVRVLDDVGAGTLSDALPGIDWVICHAKDYNIRVLNLSLAASSPESWLTDPLCVAVRSATAAGITVVVAAGNFGQNALGQETFGTIGSPGIDPSVITVGASHTSSGTARAQRRQRQPVQLARPDAWRAASAANGVRRDRQPAQARPRRAGQQDRRRGHLDGDVSASPPGTPGLDVSGASSRRLGIAIGTLAARR